MTNQTYNRAEDLGLTSAAGVFAHVVTLLNVQQWLNSAVDQSQETTSIRRISGRVDIESTKPLEAAICLVQCDQFLGNDLTTTTEQHEFEVLAGYCIGETLEGCLVLQARNSKLAQMDGINFLYHTMLAFSYAPKKRKQAYWKFPTDSIHTSVGSSQGLRLVLCIAKTVSDVGAIGIQHVQRIVCSTKDTLERGW